jgi:recombination associated protein RdgC
VEKVIRQIATTGAMQPVRELRDPLFFLLVNARANERRVVNEPAVTGTRRKRKQSAAMKNPAHPKTGDQHRSPTSLTTKGTQMSKITFCKNAVLYSFARDVTKEQVFEALEAKLFTECQPQSWSSYGFLKEVGEPVARSTGNIIHFRLRHDEKLLPSSVISAEVNRQIREIMENEGMDSVNRGRRAVIKEAVTLEMIKKAFVQTRVTQAMIDLENRILIVDAPTFARADYLTAALISGVAKQIGEPLQLKKWAVSQSPEYYMTIWAQSGEAPDEFSIDDCAVFEDAKGGKVRIAGKNLHNETIQKLAGQSLCKELALTHDDQMSFTLHSSTAIKRIRFVGIREANEEQGDMLEDERNDAEIILMASAIWKTAAALTEILGGNPNIET